MQNVALVTKGGRRFYAEATVFNAWNALSHLRTTSQVEAIITAFLPNGWECEIKEVKHIENPLQLSLPFPTTP